MTKPIRLRHPRAALAEGPLWHGGQFLWVDIEEGQILAATGDQVHVVRDFGFRVSALVPRSRGGFLLATERGVFSMDELDGELQFLADPEAGNHHTRFNDGKCDPQGRFWLGSMGYQAQPGFGALYRIDPDGSCRPMIERVTISNGLAWSLNAATFYFIDSPSRVVQAFPFDGKTGELGIGRPAIAIPDGDGIPDGMAIDSLGRLWVALWDGWKVACYDPQTGLEVDRIPLPVSRPTSCAFGGPDLRDLLITTASVGLDEAALGAQPQAGAIFKVRLETPGLPAATFHG